MSDASNPLATGLSSAISDTPFPFPFPFPSIPDTDPDEPDSEPDIVIYIFEPVQEATSELVIDSSVLTSEYTAITTALSTATDELVVTTAARTTSALGSVESSVYSSIWINEIYTDTDTVSDTNTNIDAAIGAGIGADASSFILQNLDPELIADTVTIIDADTSSIISRIKGTYIDTDTIPDPIPDTNTNIHAEIGTDIGVDSSRFFHQNLDPELIADTSSFISGVNKIHVDTDTIADTNTITADTSSTPALTLIDPTEYTSIPTPSQTPTPPSIQPSIQTTPPPPPSQTSPINMPNPTAANANETNAPDTASNAVAQHANQSQLSSGLIAAIGVVLFFVGFFAGLAVYCCLSRRARKRATAKDTGDVEQSRVYHGSNARDSRGSMQSHETSSSSRRRSSLRGGHVVQGRGDELDKHATRFYSPVIQAHNLHLTTQANGPESRNEAWGQDTYTLPPIAEQPQFSMPKQTGDSRRSVSAESEVDPYWPNVPGTSSRSKYARTTKKSTGSSKYSRPAFGSMRRSMGRFASRGSNARSGSEYSQPSSIQNASLRPESDVLRD
ncbi:hypothetical protein EJ05DRAFT_495805 [Pseudovirgaria hyperparasitica]|uniref:Uncharacterized protein n=1 Tax=Pseudovirgaria hyperparasitica TaxID=470096 RepID=A0A6A6WLC8_9PEZI|nr:uncharacterized protein EJ05DRAFT_495805 [Pseudovirgaria hyperparasitica]KAF2762958.1 hypothetical protein EJ05DRAFT_495805 [Pseudovirgaria hyperparasitica]